jgi:hypothetical protein
VTNEAKRNEDTVEPLVRVSIGDCSCWILRVASFVYLHVLAWRVLLRGPQDVTHRATFTANNAVSLSRPAAGRE